MSPSLWWKTGTCQKNKTENASLKGSSLRYRMPTWMSVPLSTKTRSATRFSAEKVSKRPSQWPFHEEHWTERQTRDNMVDGHKKTLGHQYHHSGFFLLPREYLKKFSLCFLFFRADSSSAAVELESVEPASSSGVCAGAAALDDCEEVCDEAYESLDASRSSFLGPWLRACATLFASATAPRLVSDNDCFGKGATTCKTKIYIGEGAPSMGAQK